MTCSLGIAALCASLGSLPVTGASSAGKPPTTASARSQHNSSPTVEIYSWAYGSSRHAWFEWITATAAIGGSLDDTGWRARLTGGIGAYASPLAGGDVESIAPTPLDMLLPHIDNAGKLYGSDGFGGAQIGYALVEKDWEIGGFLGVGLSKDTYLGSNISVPTLRLPADVESGLTGTQYGILGSLEFNATPSDEVRLTASAIYTTAYRWGYFEIKPGVAFPFQAALPAFMRGKTFVGPHAALNLYRGEQQQMIGAHFTCLEVGPLYMSLAGGYAHDRSTDKGAYLILETSARF